MALGAYVYPPWAQVIGKMLFVIPVLIMVGGGVAHLIKCQGVSELTLANHFMYCIHADILVGINNKKGT